MEEGIGLVAACFGGVVTIGAWVITSDDDTVQTACQGIRTHQTLFIDRMPSQVPDVLHPTTAPIYTR